MWQPPNNAGLHCHTPAVVKDMTDGGSAAAHTHAEGEAAGECPACGTPPVADPAPAGESEQGVEQCRRTVQGLALC